MPTQSESGIKKIACLAQYAMNTYGLNVLTKIDRLFVAGGIRLSRCARHERFTECGVTRFRRGNRPEKNGEDGAGLCPQRKIAPHKALLKQIVD